MIRCRNSLLYINLSCNASTSELWCNSFLQVLLPHACWTRAFVKLWERSGLACAWGPRSSRYAGWPTEFNKIMFYIVWIDLTTIKRNTSLSLMLKEELVQKRLRYPSVKRYGKYAWRMRNNKRETLLSCHGVMWQETQRRLGRLSPSAFFLDDLES